MITRFMKKQKKETINKFNCDSKKGFSMVELIFTMSLLMITTIFVFNSVQSSQVIFDKNNTDVKGRNNLRSAMTVIKRDLREAKQGIDTASCNVDAPNGVCIKSSPAKLSFKVPEGTSGSQTTYKTVKFVFDSAAQTITRYEIPSTSTPVTSAITGKIITSASFSQSNAAYVLVTLTSGVKSLASQISLRNK